MKTRPSQSFLEMVSEWACCLLTTQVTSACIAALTFTHWWKAAISPCFHCSSSQGDCVVSPVPHVPFLSHRWLCCLLFPHLKYTRTKEETNDHLASPGLSLQKSCRLGHRSEEQARCFSSQHFRPCSFDAGVWQISSGYNAEGRGTGRR